MANKIANRAVMCEVLKEAASRDKNIVVLCSDSRGSASLSSFAEEFPAQFVEVGIAEQNLVSIAAGLASCGKKSYRGSSYCIDLIPKTRIEIIVKEEGVDLIVDAIKKSAYTGNIGDGKIFIYPVDNVIRIRTGEEGDSAV